MKMEETTVTFNLNLTFTPESDGRYTVNCKELPELITGGDTLDMALENAKESFETILEVYSSVKEGCQSRLSRTVLLLAMKVMLIICCKLWYQCQARQMIHNDMHGLKCGN